MADIPKPDLIGDAELATTSKTSPDVFGDIDKRLGILLDRANKLETTLNRLNEKCENNCDDDLELELISGTEIDDNYNFEVDVSDLDADDDNDNDNDSNADVNADANVDVDEVARNVEKIDLNAQED